MEPAIDEAKHCPICSSSDTAVLREQDTTLEHFLDDVQPFELLVGCRSCAFAFRWPVLRNEDVRRYYGANAFWGEGAITTNLYYRNLARIRAALAAESSRPAPRSVLEIGAFNGAFLEEWKALAPDSERFAAETDPQCIEHLRKSGIRVEREPAAFGRRFDLICLFHVVEHYPDPIGFLAEIVADLLLPGGHLFFEVPHRDDRRKQLMSRAVHHVSFFSAGSVETLASSLGLTPVSCATYGAERTVPRLLLSHRATVPLLRLAWGTERRLLGRSRLQPWLNYQRYRFDEPSSDGTVLRAVLQKPDVDPEGA